MKSWQVILGVVVALVGLYIFVLTRTSNQVTPPPVSSDTMIYYWSITCPHCKNVSNFLSTWPNTDKLKLDKREVSENKTNQALFIEAGKTCNIPPDQMGVPLLITTDNKCISGDQPVIDYFKSLFPESSGSATPSSAAQQQY